MRKFLCLGFNVDKEKGYVTGLAMMHDLFIAILRENGYKVKSISLNSRGTKGDEKVGKPSLGRYTEYVSIIGKVLWTLITNSKMVFYFNPSTAKAGFYRDILLVVLAKLFGHKVLMQQFGALFESFKNGLSNKEQKILSWAYNKADMIIVEGEYAKSQYSFVREQNKIKTIQNGLPELGKKIEKSPKEYKEGSTFNMFFMNNMIESKGYVDVLKAVDILVNDKKQDVRCVFAGSFMMLGEDEYFKSKDEARGWFEKFIEERGLRDRVKYLDCVFDDAKAEQFKSANVFLLPSYYVFEGQPTAILEALSYGCVPIVTRYRLIPDMVDENCGIFVEKKSPEAIADAVIELMENPRKYKDLSENGYKKFNERFTQEAYAKRIIKEISVM